MYKPALSCLFASLAAGAAVPSPLHLFARDGPAAGTVIQSCAEPGVLALTYDDGPYTNTKALVDILTEAGAKATFFPTGTLYGCIYDRADSVQYAYDAGMQIGSHTWTHPHVGQMGAQQLRDEMTRLEGALVDIIGVKPTYMRPPYLETGGSMPQVMTELGYRIVVNDIDSGDWNGYSPQQSEQQFQMAGAQGNGHIPLMHETYDTTVFTLTPWLIDWASQNNLRLVTVAECVGDTMEGAYAEGTPANRNSC
ncbi:chitin deacetylase [Lineolata rhizophorae]|uniref:Chitin deacetylase n=1 Tax=Lineolata rhizophorae TaxID=578093 RepID=A0A6A6P132_9PEZI|nr:chitin deacetylase [Lineolata rhizophorae]